MTWPAAFIGQPFSIQPRWRRSRDAEFRRYSAMLDTGADFSCIATSAAHMEGLLVQSRRPVNGVHGLELANAYVGDLGFLLADDDRVQHLMMLEATLLLEMRGDVGCDLLLGRDFLSDVSVHLDGPGRRFTISSEHAPIG